MWLTIDHVDTRVARANDAELKWLHYRLSIPKRNSFRTRANESLFNVARLSFPSGFVPLVRAEGPGMGFVVEVADGRKRPCIARQEVNLGWLRPIQEDVLLSFMRHERGVIQAGTASGKGELLAAIVMLYPCRWLVAVKPISLVTELRDRIALRMREQGFIERVGTVTSKGWDTDPRVVVGSVDTLHNAMRTAQGRAFLRSVQGLACDEAHHVPSTSFRSVVRAIPAYFRLGTTATPVGRSDGRDLILTGELGPVIHTVTMDDLEGRGIVAKGSVRLLRLTNERFDADFGDWAKFYEGGFVRDSGRTLRVVRAVQASEKPVLVFVRSLVHGEILLLALRAIGLRVVYVQGEDDTGVRDEALGALDRGELDVIVSTKIFTAGVNVPHLRTVLLAAGGKAPIDVIQGAGRGSRRLDRTGAEVKSSYTVVDIFDMGCRSCASGLVPERKHHRACRWMRDHARARKRTYLAAGYPVAEVLEGGVV